MKTQAFSVTKVILDWRLLLDHFASLENSLREQAKRIECWSERVEIKSKMVEEGFVMWRGGKEDLRLFRSRLKTTLKLKLIELQLDVPNNEAEVLDKKNRERKWELGLVEKELEGCNRELATKQKQ